jgi:hypothetical protein
MSPKDDLDVLDEMRTEYDLSGGVRGKFFKEYRAATNIVVLDPDVAIVFQNSENVNRALRLLIDVAKKEAASVRKKSRAPNKGTQPTAQKPRRG